jgi:hypothetical protein
MIGIQILITLRGSRLCGSLVSFHLIIVAKTGTSEYVGRLVVHDNSQKLQASRLNYLFPAIMRNLVI